MRVLATGANGFVVSNIVREVLQADNDASVILLDAHDPDELVRAQFAPYAERISVVRGSVTDRVWLEELDLDGITHTVHGAAVTNYHRAEYDTPERFIEVNVIGSINVIRRVAREPTLQRVVNISSGAVYGNPTEASPETAQPEEGPFNPQELYAISKYAAERAAQRYSALTKIDLRTVRLSDVFGPMERPTPARASMSLPYKMVRSVLERRPLTLTQESLAAGGDFISADRVADAVSRLLRASSLRHDIFNVAYGQYTLVRDLFDQFTTSAPAFRYEVVDGAAEVSLSPKNRRARWNAYTITRIREDVGWQPTPISEQLARYLRWAYERQRPLLAAS